ncbi:MAG TPA: hypothetical protein VF219_17690 [Vicinamibacterales bacterium]
MRSRMLGPAVVCLAIAATTFLSAPRKYDLLLKGGHVIDARNGVSAILDVAIAEGRVAAVAANINATDALKSSTSQGSTSRRASSTCTSMSTPARANVDLTPATTASIPTASR